MSWNPPMEIGLWNAWILMLFFPLHPVLMTVIDKAVGTGEIWKKVGDTPVEKGAKRVNMLCLVLQVLLLAYSLFLPLRLGSTWFAVGLAVYLVGLVMLIATIVVIAATPAGIPFTRGPYTLTRHPAYVSQTLLFVGTALAAGSWVFLLVALGLSYLIASFAAEEEQSCLENFGEAYRAYMDRTPRWLGIPKAK